MKSDTRFGAVVLGVSIFLGLIGLAYIVGEASVRFKSFERSVVVKGLAEREYPADIVIWPIQYTAASNDLESLYLAIESNNRKIQTFLIKAGIKQGELSMSAPAITDKSAQQYGGGQRAEFRYTGSQIITVYSSQIDRVRSLMASMSELGKQGIVFSSDNYNAQPEYLFTGLNDVKPSMIEEATRKAREVAQKFAKDSDSSLGKIKKARQGQFSISERDKNNPHIKKIRVVSTIEYYLSD